MGETRPNFEDEISNPSGAFGPWDVRRYPVVRDLYTLGAASIPAMEKWLDPERDPDNLAPRLLNVRELVGGNYRFYYRQLVALATQTGYDFVCDRKALVIPRAYQERRRGRRLEDVPRNLGSLLLDTDVNTNPDWLGTLRAYMDYMGEEDPWGFTIYASGAMGKKGARLLQQLVEQQTSPRGRRYISHIVPQGPGYAVPVIAEERRRPDHYFFFPVTPPTPPHQGHASQG